MTQQQLHWCVTFDMAGQYAAQGKWHALLQSRVLRHLLIALLVTQASGLTHALSKLISPEWSCLVTVPHAC